jgi:hypothetical protein
MAARVRGESELFIHGQLAAVAGPAPHKTPAIAIAGMTARRVKRMAFLMSIWTNWQDARQLPICQVASNNWPLNYSVMRGYVG